MSADPSTLRLLLQPRLVGLHLFAVAALVFTIVMGLWQLGVYDSRQADERADQRSVPTVPLDQVLGPDEVFTGKANHRPVTTSGRFAPADEQFWVSGRERGGRSGYWLVAPFLVEGQPASASGRFRALLVVRGWASDNDTLPATPAGSVELAAVLEPGEEAAGGIDERRTTATLRIPLLINELPYDLYSGYAIVTDQRPADTAGLERVAPPVADPSWTLGLRNLAYAIQWWVFGAFAMFMWWRMSRDVVAGDRARAVAGVTDGTDRSAVAEQGVSTRSGGG